jgi:hypothetical protein
MYLDPKFREFLWVEIEGKFTGNSWNFGIQWNLASKLLITPYFKENKFLAKEDQKFEYPLKMKFGLILL